MAPKFQPQNVQRVVDDLSRFMPENLCKVLPDARNDIAQFSSLDLRATAFEPAVQKYAKFCDLKVAVIKISSDKEVAAPNGTATIRRKTLWVA
jgi:hypothetical protein